jgi:hypothetical protein
VEVLVALLVMVVVMSALLGVVSRAGNAITLQPETSDAQQRLRVAIATLQRDLLNAGAGGYVGPVAGALSHYIAPVQPYRWGADPTGAFRDDVVTVIYVPADPAQATIAEVRVNPGEDAELGLRDDDGAHTFEAGMRVMIVEPAGEWAFGTITSVAPGLLHVRAATEVPPSLDAGRSTVFEVSIHTYSLKRDAGTGAFQLVHYDGADTEMPVIDNVVSMRLRFWLEQPGGGGLVEAAGASLSDGPWLPDAASPLRYDADLLRIRRVSVQLRVQVASSWLRVNGDRSRVVPDGELTLEVAPPNLNFAW